MTIITIPIDSKIEEFINSQIAEENFSSKSDVVRAALRKYMRDIAVADLLQSRKEIKEGKIFYGDLDELAKKI